MLRRFVSCLALILVLVACSDPQPAVRTLPVNGVDLAYRITGQGEPLLLIMGYGGTMDVWDPALVKELARQYQVICFDNRNVGRSGASDAPVTMRLMAEDALGLLNGLGFEKAHVLGWSMGSIIAQEMALSAPDRLGKIVLYGSAHTSESVMVALKQFDGLTSEQFAALLFPKKWVAQHSDVYSHLPHPSVPATPEAVVRQKQAIARWSGSTDRLPTLDKDVLLIVGQEDTITPPEQSVSMTGLIPGSWLLRYKCAGHWLMYQNPVSMASDIRHFLEGRQDLLDSQS